MSQADHARLPPSSAASWVKCPGWRAMHDAFPEEGDNGPAMEGTAAHWVFEQLLAGHDVVEGIIAPNGVEVTDEMIDGANMFCDCVGVPHNGHVEKRVSMPQIHPENWGTPDFFGLRNGILRVIDYKFGHKYVEEFENWQMIDYAVGIINFLQIRPEHKTDIHLTIVQPRHFGRAGPIRTWETTYDEIVRYAGVLRTAALAAMEETPVCVVGGQCFYCPGRHACETLQRAVLSVVDQSFTSIPLHLSNEAAARELHAMSRSASLLQSRITGITELLLAQLRAGQTVPGFAAERAQGRQKWMRPPEEIIALGQLMGIKLDKPAVITPKQAIKAGLPAEIVAPISEEPLGEWKLVEVSNKASSKAFANN